MYVAFVFASDRVFITPICAIFHAIANIVPSIKTHGTVLALIEAVLVSVDGGVICSANNATNFVGLGLVQMRYAGGEYFVPLIRTRSIAITKLSTVPRKTWTGLIPFLSAMITLRICV